MLTSAVTSGSQLFLSITSGSEHACMSPLACIRAHVYVQMYVCVCVFELFCRSNSAAFAAKAFIHLNLLGVLGPFTAFIDGTVIPVTVLYCCDCHHSRLPSSLSLSLPFISHTSDQHNTSKRYLYCYSYLSYHYFLF